MRDPYTKDNISTGPSMTTSRRRPPLAYNIANISVGEHQLGSAPWKSALLQALRFVDHPELQPILKNETLRLELFNAIGRTKPAPVSMRVQRAIEQLQNHPREHLSFVTVVTDIALTKEQAVELANSTGARLDRFIRRRFDNATWILIPEVDVKLASNVQAGLVTHRRWYDRIKGNHLVYKVHFHGVVYAPGLTPSQVERAFKFNRNQKRSKTYAGHNQVRAIAIRDRPNGQPDVQGVVGYAQKTHFKPPVVDRMLEGAAEWLWIAEKILSQSQLIKIGGVHPKPPSTVTTASNDECSQYEEGASNADENKDRLKERYPVNSEPNNNNNIYSCYTALCFKIDFCGCVKKTKQRQNQACRRRKRRWTPHNPAAP